MKGSKEIINTNSGYRLPLEKRRRHREPPKVLLMVFSLHWKVSEQMFVIPLYFMTYINVNFCIYQLFRNKRMSIKI